MSDIILPAEWLAHQEYARQNLPEVKPGDERCPAASLAEYSDTHRLGLFCGVERKHFPVDESPLAVAMWCCDLYERCPVWQAGKDNDPALERTIHAQEQAKQDALTEDQVQRGVRVDDRLERMSGEDAEKSRDD